MAVTEERTLHVLSTDSGERAFSDLLEADVSMAFLHADAVMVFCVGGPLLTWFAILVHWLVKALNP